MADIRTYQGLSPKLGERVFIDHTAVVIGDVVLGDDSSIWPLTVVRGDMHSIRIGKRTSVQDGSVLHITHASDFNPGGFPLRSEEHTSELQSRPHLVCRLLLEKK